MVTLRPFSSNGLEKISVEAAITHLQHQLQVQFFLRGPWPSLRPSLSILGTGQRRDELWKETCFEFFIGDVDSDAYFEFNVSPQADWACYRFAGYRQNVLNYSSIESVQWNLRLTQSGIVAQIIVPCPAELILKKLRWRPAFISKFDNNQIHYWTHHHGLERPDFHLMQDALFL
jgi:hypothetical protein